MKRTTTANSYYAEFSVHDHKASHRHHVCNRKQILEKYVSYEISTYVYAVTPQRISYAFL